MPSIIIIDDDTDAVETLKDYLEEIKMIVLACGYNGKDAVELYKKHKPDVVLLDLTMPEFDGYYAIENIKKIDPVAKIIILTGSVEEKFDERIDEHETYAIFTKPYDIDELITMVEKCCIKPEQVIS